MIRSDRQTILTYSIAIVCYKAAAYSFKIFRTLAVFERHYHILVKQPDL